MGNIITNTRGLIYEPIGDVLYSQAFKGQSMRAHQDYDWIEAGKKLISAPSIKMRLKYLEEHCVQYVLKRDWFGALKHTGKHAIKFRR